MKIALFSDIHGNKVALNAVLEDVKQRNEVQGIILLGDLIDYGPHSNEVIDILSNIDFPIICNIWGNHEAAIIKEEYSRFSSIRGQISAKDTRSKLSTHSIKYIKDCMVEDGFSEFEIDSKKCLAVHGSLEDKYWRSIFPDGRKEAYAFYDYVFSGHSHEPHFFERYFKINNPQQRDRKKTIFINPGSIGQPRNINCKAQYAIFDTIDENCSLIKVSYDIESEMIDFSRDIDVFYRDRIKKGI